MEEWSDLEAYEDILAYIRTVTWSAKSAVSQSLIPISTKASFTSGDP